MEEDIWNIISWAGPRKTELKEAYGSEDGYYSSDIDAWYKSGEWRNEEEMVRFYERLKTVANQLGITEPSRDMLVEWNVAESLNKDYYTARTQSLGSDIMDVMQVYWDASSSERRKIRKVEPRIDDYYTFQDMYTMQNPIWAKYYNPTGFDKLPVSIQQRPASQSQLVIRMDVPDGFEEAAGEQLTQSVQQLMSSGTPLSSNARVFLANLAKRHTDWQPFITNVLSK